VFENGGHECLLAKAWCPGFDPAAPAPPEPPLDLTSRYSAQRNVTVVHAPPGQAFALRLEVANITRFGLEAVVEARALGFEEVARGLRAAYPDQFRHLVGTEQRLPLELDLSRERSFHYVPNRTFGRLLDQAEEAAVTGRQEARRPRGHTMFRQAVPLEPWERRVLTVAGHVPATARPGQAFGIDLAQSLGDLVVGGYTVFVVAGRA
jgi:hypothetical protein